MHRAVIETHKGHHVLTFEVFFSFKPDKNIVYIPGVGRDKCIAVDKTRTSVLQTLASMHDEHTTSIAKQNHATKVHVGEGSEEWTMGS